MTEDIELLREYAANGSDAAFTALVRQQLGLVYSVALRQVGGRRDLAQDVSQTVFTDLARKAKSLSDHPTLSGWLYRSTRYAAIDALRIEQRRKAREREAHTMQHLSTDPLPDEDQLRMLLDQAVTQLNERDRDAVLLRFFEGRAFGDIAKKLHVTEDAARMRVERALDKLRVFLVRSGVSSTAAAVGIALGPDVTASTIPASMAGVIAGGALTGATTTASSGGLLAFMSAQKLTAPIAIAGLIGLLSIGVGIFHYQAGVRVRQLIAVTMEQHATTQKQLQAFADSAAKEEQDLTQLQRQIAQNSTQTSPVPRGVPARTPPPVPTNAEWQRFVATHPDAQRMAVREARAMLQMQYRHFYLQSQLAPDKIEAFESRTAELQAAAAQLSPATKSPGYPPGVQMPADELRALFGDEAFQQFQEYPRIAPFLPFIDDIRRSTGQIGEPLTSEQELKLADIVTGASPDFRARNPLPRGTASAVSGQILSAVDWGAAIGQSRTVLSASQWKAAEGVFLLRAGARIAASAK